jgi:hypothetical protein
MTTESPIKTGDPVADITAKIYRVAPQMVGDRPLEDGDQERIEEIATLRKDGKLTEGQLKLLDQMGLFAIDTDEF